MHQFWYDSTSKDAAVSSGLWHHTLLLPVTGREAKWWMSPCSWVKFTWKLHTTQNYAALLVLKVYLKSRQEQGKPQGTNWQFDLEMKLNLMKYQRAFTTWLQRDNKKRSFLFRRGQIGIKGHGELLRGYPGYLIRSEKVKREKTSPSLTNNRAKQPNTLAGWFFQPRRSQAVAGRGRCEEFPWSQPGKRSQTRSLISLCRGEITSLTHFDGERNPRAPAGAHQLSACKPLRFALSPPSVTQLSPHFFHPFPSDQLHALTCAISYSSL